MAKAKMLVPCYGGPRDGRFLPLDVTPLGYRKFTVRGNTIWLWKTVAVEHINYDILEQAALLAVKDYKNLDDLG